MCPDTRIDSNLTILQVTTEFYSMLDQSSVLLWKKKMHFFLSLFSCFFLLLFLFFFFFSETVCFVIFWGDLYFSRDIEVEQMLCLLAEWKLLMLYGCFFKYCLMRCVIYLFIAGIMSGVHREIKAKTENKVNNTESKFYASSPASVLFHIFCLCLPLYHPSVVWTLCGCYRS